MRVTISSEMCEGKWHPPMVQLPPTAVRLAIRPIARVFSGSLNLSLVILTVDLLIAIDNFQ